MILEGALGIYAARSDDLGRSAWNLCSNPIDLLTLEKI